MTGSGQRDDQRWIPCIHIRLSLVAVHSFHRRCVCLLLHQPRRNPPGNSCHVAMFFWKVACTWLGGGFGGAWLELGWSLGGAWVALGGRNQLAINALWGGLSVAWGWLYCGFTLALLSHSPPNPLPITWLYPGFAVALPGLERLDTTGNGSSKTRTSLPKLVTGAQRCAGH
jgi:hypothetical protein